MTATAKKIAAAAQDTVNGHIEQAEQWLDQTPGALSHAAGKVEHLTRVGVEKAREAGAQVAQGASQACTRTADYVREEPGKSLLAAALAGAAITALAGWATRSRWNHR